VKIGVVLDGRRSAAEVAELAALAEAVGLPQFWLSSGARTKDHFQRLAVAATRTRRIQLGAVAVSPFEAHPARLAVELLTLDEIAGGRAAVAVGAGGDFAAALGVRVQNRVAAVAETLDIIRAVARGGRVRYRGSLFEVRDFFSPWALEGPPPLYVAANRPRLLGLAATRADGVMFADMPPEQVATLVARLRAAQAAAGRPAGALRVSNWFVWNVQETAAEALALARRRLGFRLYYIRDVAAMLGLGAGEVAALERNQADMRRAVLEGREPWLPEPALTDRLVRALTLSGGLADLDRVVERLRAFARAGLDEIALAPHGDPARAIRLLGERVQPTI
jgi:alkanesulfonate monooxygenase SsuD/methylene tetrahydromethanopterin reductase-like flavin-dependent oxidoreductase (luciferase family)